MIGSIAFDQAINNTDFETFVAYKRTYEKITYAARMKTKRRNENFEEDCILEYSPVVFIISDFLEACRKLSKEYISSLPIQILYPVRIDNIFNEYHRCFKMLEEYDRGVMQSEHNESMDIFKKCIEEKDYKTLNELFGKNKSCDNTKNE